MTNAWCSICDRTVTEFDNPATPCAECGALICERCIEEGECGVGASGREICKKCWEGFLGLFENREGA